MNMFHHLPLCSQSLQLLPALIQLVEPVLDVIIADV